MNMDKATTLTGLLKAVTVATATVSYAQDEIVYWMGLAFAILAAVQGYLTNK